MARVRFSLPPWLNASGNGLGLRAKIIAWAFVPTALILLAVSLVTFWAYQQVTEETVVERDRELTRLSAGQIVAELAEYSERLATEARTLDIAQGVPSRQREALVRARNRLVVFDGGVLIFDNFGVVTAANPPRPENLGQNWSDRPYVRRMLLTPGPLFSDVEADGRDGTDVIVVAVPIIGARGEFQGTLAGMFQVGASTISSFYGDLVKLRLGKSGNAYLVDSRGRVIYHSDTNRIGDDFSGQAVVQQVLAGQTDARRTRSVVNQDIVAAYAPVPGTPWGLVTEEDWETLSRPSRGYRQFLLLLLVLGVVAPSLFVAIGVRRITQPIGDLIEAAQAVAAGNFDQQIVVHTNDEIAELARQFNHMSGQLQRSYAEMEQRVAERTQELATLNAVAQTTNRSLELETMLSTTLGKVLEVLAFETGVIYLVNAKSGDLEMAYEQGVPATFRRRGVLSTRAAETGEPLIIDNLSAEPDVPQALLEAGYRSAASIPLISKGQVQGVLSAASRSLHHFRPQDVDLLLSIGNQIGIAIENARLYETEQRRAEQFRVISEVGRSITSILAVETLLVQMTRLVQRTFDYYHVGIGLVEEDEVVYRVGAGPLWDDPDFRFNPSRLKVGVEGISGRVAATGQPLLVSDVTREPRYILMEGSQTRSELVLPIKVKDQVIAVLDVQQDVVNGFDEVEVTVLQALANQAGIAIENARLYEQAQQLAVWEERQRLARDLHDSVTQALYGVTLYAEAAARLLGSGNAVLAGEHLRNLRDTAQEALGEMRLLIYELRPSVLAEEGLMAALQARLESVEERAGLETALTVEGVEALAPDIEEGVYWISQEALNNALKHARAQKVTVALRALPSQRVLFLEIADDGIGFDPARVREQGGWGLRGMQERVALLGGTLTIHSHPGQGTRVSVEIQT